MKHVFSVIKPESNISPLVCDSPHSGSLYPADFNFSCDLEVLKQAEDNFVDDLIADAPHFGANLLVAHFPRSYIDTNRAICDIDPDILEEPWPYDTNPSSRCAAGFGLIRRLVRPGIAVYERKLSVEEVYSRIQNYYKPYHKALEELIQSTHYNFGQCWHINFHSMPYNSAFPKSPIAKSRPSLLKPKAVDFCLGNRDGYTCSREFLQDLRSYISSLGFKVSLNDPFKGVELIKAYSQPQKNIHSLQLEINKSLYMDEKTLSKRDDFQDFKAEINKIIVFCAEYSKNMSQPLAAD